MKGFLLIALIDRINNLLFNLNRMSCRSVDCMCKKGLFNRQREWDEEHLLMVVVVMMVMALSKNRPIWNFEYFVIISMRMRSWRHKRASHFRLDFKCSMFTMLHHIREGICYRYYTHVRINIQYIYNRHWMSTHWWRDINNLAPLLCIYRPLDALLHAFAHQLPSTPQLNHKKQPILYTIMSYNN